MISELLNPLKNSGDFFTRIKLGYLGKLCSICVPLKEKDLQNFL
jgi:hypothetical protein